MVEQDISSDGLFACCFEKANPILRALSPKRFWGPIFLGEEAEVAFDHQLAEHDIWSGEVCIRVPKKLV